MASPSSGSSLIQNSVDETISAILDQRKRKRMISNRESARRSRMRRQKHVDDLTAQVAQLTMDNHQIVARIAATTQAYLGLESENSVLRAQVRELTHRLLSLSDIVEFLATSKPLCSLNDEPNTFFDPLNEPYCGVYEY